MSDLNFRDDVAVILQRELRAVRREIELYPDDESLWKTPPGIGNSGGNLALHLAGNLRHFVGARIGSTGYQRDRPSEFSARGIPRAEVLARLDAAIAEVRQAMTALQPDALDRKYSEVVAGFHYRTGDFLLHLATHLAYHLGQIDYHRRLVTGDPRTAATLTMAEMNSATKPEASAG